MDLTSQIVLQAQQELLSPQHFQRICQQFRQGKQRLYFLQPSPELLDLNKGIGVNELRCFFDYLSEYVKHQNQVNQKTVFYLQRVLIGGTRKIFSALRISKNKPLPYSLKLTVIIAGEGMVGRVACVTINGVDLAFKAFFDPDFVWLHGPWGEIPAGIYLKKHQVSLDVPVFQFAGESWAVWEWIYPHTSPENRKGISYAEFAQLKGLTTLNVLNTGNYNPHNIRLDIGGIQKDYIGRRFYDLIKGTFFYLRKFRREGFSFIISHLSWHNFLYLWLRLFRLVFPKIT